MVIWMGRQGLTSVKIWAYHSGRYDQSFLQQDDQDEPQPVTDSCHPALSARKPR